MKKNSLLSAALMLLCAGGVTSLPSPAFAGGEEGGVFEQNVPGSFLVFPKFDIRGDTATQLRIVNHGDKEINVKLNYVCPGVKNVNQFCAALDRQVSFTPKQTRVIDVADQNPPCNQGYVVAFALMEDSYSQAVSYNELTGSYNINSGRRVEAENAVTVQSEKPEGEPLGMNGKLRFGGQHAGASMPEANGADYRGMPSVLGTDFRAITPGVEGESADQGSTLTLLTLDTLAGQQNPAALAFIDFWNAAEEPFSSSVEFVCWTEKQLDAIDANFLEENLGTTYGSMKITPSPNCPIPGGCPPLQPFDATMLGAISEYGDGDVSGRLLSHDDTPKCTSYQPR
jgi:hypothetical protein